MLLTARPLINVSDVNSWEYADEVKFTQGDQVFVYFQLIDSQKDKTLKMPGKRYVPATGATLLATLNSIDINKTYTKVATQPFPGDLSIWRIQVLASDTIVGTLSMKLVLTESGISTYGVVKNMLSVEAQSQGLV
jgi:hypothetical protein